MSVAAAGFAVLAGGSAGAAAWALGERVRALRLASWVSGAADRVRATDGRRVGLALLEAAGEAQLRWPSLRALAERRHAPVRAWLGEADPGPAAWLASKEVLAATAAVVIGWLAEDAVTGAVAGLAAAFLPDLIARDRWMRRCERVRRELPDVLDLLGLALEAGLSIDAALTQAADKLAGGPLADAIGRMLGEIRFGARRHDAWDRMAARLGVPEVTDVMNALAQADRMGVGLIGALRGLAEQTRARRRQQIEEAAQKAPVKLLFPLAFFIFPCIFIVLLGPVFLQLLAVTR